MQSGLRIEEQRGVVGCSVADVVQQWSGWT